MAYLRGALLLLACSLQLTHITAIPFEERSADVCSSNIYGELVPLLQPNPIAQAYCKAVFPAQCRQVRRRKADPPRGNPVAKSSSPPKDASPSKSAVRPSSSQIAARSSLQPSRAASYSPSSSPKASAIASLKPSSVQSSYKASATSKLSPQAAWDKALKQGYSVISTLCSCIGTQPACSSSRPASSSPVASSLAPSSIAPSVVASSSAAPSPSFSPAANCKPNGARVAATLEAPLRCAYQECCSGYCTYDGSETFCRERPIQSSAAMSSPPPSSSVVASSSVIVASSSAAPSPSFSPAADCSPNGAFVAANINPPLYCDFAPCCSGYCGFDGSTSTCKDRPVQNSPAMSSPPPSSSVAASSSVIVASSSAAPSPSFSPVANCKPNGAFVNPINEPPLDCVFSQCCSGYCGYSGSYPICKDRPNQSSAAMSSLQSSSSIVAASSSVIVASSSAAASPSFSPAANCRRNGLYTSSTSGGCDASPCCSGYCSITGSVASCEERPVQSSAAMPSLSPSSSVPRSSSVAVASSAASSSPSSVACVNPNGAADGSSVSAQYPDRVACFDMLSRKCCSDTSSNQVFDGSYSCSGTCGLAGSPSMVASSVAAASPSASPSPRCINATGREAGVRVSSTNEDPDRCYLDLRSQCCSNQITGEGATPYGPRFNCEATCT